MVKNDDIPNEKKFLDINIHVKKAPSYHILTKQDYRVVEYSG
ncbi:15610_t:CDS:2 [Cetraspora pellucida]|uniref:15610_t:CDS:1 n=1 Tax=Cetraspora pellucida TaxID=1433469 RepID=A0A9N9NUJ7_9GLOM|nr:15610_t:CDS:2 [Cetraspora pellucida]